MFFARRAGQRWVERQGLSGDDLTEATMTEDATWRPWDISAIVGTRKVLVCISLTIRANIVNGFFALRPKDSTQEGAVRSFNTQTAGTAYFDAYTLVETDATGKLDYYAAACTWNNIKLKVCGWFV